VNRLRETTSPYLHQHADNPVDWYPWGEEALARARAEDRPILLSVGYAACHWCHVMAHESFEDPEVAALMNERFINIKVDREERPDIDAIYQKVVQLMGQGGGWPLTVFLTPDQRPFYGGTYFPPTPNHGRPSFRQVLLALGDLWQQRRGELDEQVKNFAEGMADMTRLVDEDSRQVSVQTSLSDARTLDEVVRRLLPKVDQEWGGFGRQPKFPSPTNLKLLLQATRSPAIDVAQKAGAALLLTLEKMWRGGLYDHLRGGFARYSTDRVWLVPHFEKMLYDNAQLLGVYAEASRVWPDHSFLREVVRETAAYLAADMRDPCGGFYAATDADSEGVEGKFFCWTPAQLREQLEHDEAAERFAQVYGVTAAGNFEHGMSILHLPRSYAETAATLGTSEQALRDQLRPMRQRLLEHRYTRVPPLRDEKLLTSWNALAISGLVRAAEAAETWGEPDLAREWLALAETAGQYLLAEHVTVDGRVLRAAFAGQAHTRGYAEDLGALARACLDLHEATLAPRWLHAAQGLARHALMHHASPGGVGFYMTADDAEQLIERSECEHDSALPSGLGLLVEVLLRLDASDAGPPGGRATAEAVMHRYRGAVAQPFAYASLVAAARYGSPEAVHVKLLAETPDAAADLARRVRAERALLPAPLSLHWAEAEGPPTAIVCRAQACSAPLRDPAALAPELHGAEGFRYTDR